MVISTSLECWLCAKTYSLTLEIQTDVEWGNPHFWCRHCCAPRTLSRMLKKVLENANRPVPVRNMNADEILAVKKILARQNDADMPTSSLSEWRQYADFTRDESDESDMAA